MNEADQIVSAHGVACVDVIRNRIEKALAEDDEAEALRLDTVLQQIEQIIGSAGARRLSLPNGVP